MTIALPYVSTRGSAPEVAIGQAIRDGAAPDGGLYLPATVPAIDLLALRGLDALPDFAARFLAPFFAGDPLAAELDAICREAFDFPIAMVTPDPARPALTVLELFHGPTGAFKDFGARFLMACFDRLGDPAQPLTVLVATSGDTGGAVGCAAEGRKAVQAAILYPRGRVSAFQELQLTCWNAPVQAFEVEGDFDDCQRMVKAAFADKRLSAALRLTSANSINIGRLLPQAAYLAFAAARRFEETGIAPGLLIPTGNLGHGFAAVYARLAGAPIGPIVAVTNANRTLSEWHRSGVYAPGPSIATIANAMDVGAPSNFERLMHLPEEARRIGVVRVDDDTIRTRIRTEYDRSGYIWDPHSATAAEAFDRMDAAEKGDRPWIAAATAHPYKFADVVEPVIGINIAPPPALEAILGRTARKVAIAAEDAALTDALTSSFGAKAPV
ncbi:MAG TPA: threonine synthase [Allosphingosinicella sp.]|nr:threonine synthase [Allosphingosinicella sp.]